MHILVSVACITPMLVPAQKACSKWPFCRSHPAPSIVRDALQGTVQLELNDTCCIYYDADFAGIMCKPSQVVEAVDIICHEDTWIPRLGQA